MASRSPFFSFLTVTDVKSHSMSGTIPFSKKVEKKFLLNVFKLKDKNISKFIPTHFLPELGLL